MDLSNEPSHAYRSPKFLAIVISKEGIVCMVQRLSTVFSDLLAWHGLNIQNGEGNKALTLAADLLMQVGR